ncbi:MAG TPA: NAD(P)H oxidoreductase [Thermohalobaculum sp.]|nr:NAD(P)H oxidoreductase [Thermohalobaculum sp.]
MKVLTVFDHPRRDSFCGAVLDSFVSGLSQAGHMAEIADLHAEGFDPRMVPADEPDWNDSAKRYSDAVLAEQARISRNDALAFVFPVWWWSMPAMLKGWIDRVWNNGWAYGSNKLPHRRALLIGTASSTAEGYRKRGYDGAMEVQLITGIMNYCGIQDAELNLMYDVTGDPARRDAYLLEAGQLGRDFANRSGG